MYGYFLENFFLKIQIIFFLLKKKKKKKKIFKKLWDFLTIS